MNWPLLLIGGHAWNVAASDDLIGYFSGDIWAGKWVFHLSIHTSLHPYIFHAANPVQIHQEPGSYPRKSKGNPQREPGPSQKLVIAFIGTF